MTRLKKLIDMLLHQKSRNLDRSSKVDSQQVSANRFPKSGFDLTYRSYNDFQLGRLHVSGYHHTMPGDKFNGLNQGSFQFNRLVTPVVSPVEVSQHNFYIPYRSLDTSFEDAFAPGKLNNMSEDWHAPSFSLNFFADKVFLTNFDSSFGVGSLLPIPDFEPVSDMVLYYGGSPLLFSDLLSYAPSFVTPRSALNSVFSNGLRSLEESFVNLYLLDILDEIVANLNSVSESWDEFLIPYGGSEFVSYTKLALAYYDAVTRYFIGEGSLLDQLGYMIVRRVDLMTWNSFRKFFSVVTSQSANFMDFRLSDIPMSEYPIRAYYAIWYEYYRDLNLEPVNANLPKYRHFGSESIVEQYPAIVCMRPRCWRHDLHVSSMPDDPFRHVFAPVLVSDTGQIVNGNIETPQRGSFNSMDAEYPVQGLADVDDDRFINSNMIRSETVTWLDPVDGTNKTLKLPIPALVSDAISAMDEGRAWLANRLDLQALRRAQALERVLKRNFYFGDEYKDRMLAHYGSVVSDERVNRPAVLSSSVTTINTSEQIANVGSEETPQGTRNVVATASTGNDGYTFFAEEFGIVINIISFMPIAQYNGICPQLLQSKVVDFPLPEYSTQFSEASRILEVAMSPAVVAGDALSRLFGHQPYGHAYRARVDEVHGSYLSTKANYTFRRFFGMDEEANSYPKLNYLFVHCNPVLDMFANTVRADGQLYGYVDHMFTVERALPSPAEEI